MDFLFPLVADFIALNQLPGEIRNSSSSKTTTEVTSRSFDSVIHHLPIVSLVSEEIK